MADTFGRAQGVQSNEPRSRRELKKEIAKIQRDLQQAHRFAVMLSEPSWENYRSYMINELLRPAEQACRTLSPLTDAEELLRNQVRAELIRRLLEEPQVRGHDGVIQKLQEKLKTWQAALRQATRD